MGTAPQVISPYVSGRFLKLEKPDQKFIRHNPINPNEVLAECHWSKNFLSELMESAVKAERKLVATEIKDRLKMCGRIVELLSAREEDFKRALVKESGRSLYTVEQEWQLCLQLATELPQFALEMMEAKSVGEWKWQQESLGVVFYTGNVVLPLYTALSAVLNCLACGCTLVYKPGFHCPLSTQVLAEVIHTAELPAGNVQFIYGGIDVCRRTLLECHFDAVMFIGNEENTEQIRRDLSVRENCSFIFGSAGKNIAYVSDQAEIDQALKPILEGAFFDAGQRLEATGVLLVQEKIIEKFSDLMVNAIKQMPIGVRDSYEDEEQHVMGSLCSHGAWDRFLRFQNMAFREAQETLRWGKPIDNPHNGYFVSPGLHLVKSAPLSESVYTSNAIFGPDLAIMPVVDVDDVIEKVNSLDACRVLSVHSSEQEFQKIMHDTVVPTVHRGSPTTELHPLLPQSGRGRGGNGTLYGLHLMKSLLSRRCFHTLPGAG